MEKVYEQKHLHNAELAFNVQQEVWKTEVHPVEVGRRGFVGTSTTKLLRDFRIRGQSKGAAIKTTSEAGESSSQWLWLKRNYLIGLPSNKPGGPDGSPACLWLERGSRTRLLHHTDAHERSDTVQRVYCSWFNWALGTTIFLIGL